MKVSTLLSLAALQLGFVHAAPFQQNTGKKILSTGTNGQNIVSIYWGHTIRITSD